MGLTITRPLDPDSQVEGAWRIGVAQCTFDSSYASGGEDLTPADLGLSKVDFAICNIVAVGGSVNVADAFYDIANQKLELFDESPALVTGDVSNIVVQVVAFGK